MDIDIRHADSETHTIPNNIKNYEAEYDHSCIDCDVYGSLYCIVWWMTAHRRDSHYDASIKKNPVGMSQSHSIPKAYDRQGRNRMLVERH